MKVVLDTNVLVTALRSRLGLSRLFLKAALQRQFELLATPALFFEYEEVLKRPQHLAAMGLTVALVDEFLNGLVHWQERYLGKWYTGGHEKAHLYSSSERSRA